MNQKLEVKRMFEEAVGILSHSYKGSSLTDIFVLVDDASGELMIYDDEQNCITRGIIQEWESNDIDQKDYIDILKGVIAEMSHAKRFDSLDVYTPFSINFADEDFIVIEELLVIEDDSIIRIEGDFLERMDKEFDDFLDKLLKE